jgi:hypothetical protein
MTDKSPTSATLAAARELTRRKILKGTIYAGTAASIGPFVLPRRALGAGEVRVFAWSDYVGARPRRGVSPASLVRYSASADKVHRLIDHLDRAV